MKDTHIETSRKSSFLQIVFQTWNGQAITLWVITCNLKTIYYNAQVHGQQVLIPKTNCKPETCWFHTPKMWILKFMQPWNESSLFVFPINAYFDHFHFWKFSGIRKFIDEQRFFLLEFYEWNLRIIISSMINWFP